MLGTPPQKPNPNKTSKINITAQADHSCAIHGHHNRNARIITHLNTRNLQQL
jgi:hypothetical protein